MTTLVVRKRDPKIAEQWARIKQIRNQLQTVVSTPDGWLVDADMQSIQRMKERTEFWEIGTATKRGGKQLWKGHLNDTREFSLAQFNALVADVRQATAMRVDTVFAHAEGLRAQLPVADDHPMFDAASWPAP